MDSDASGDRGIHDDAEAVKNTCCSGHDSATSGLEEEGCALHTPTESARTDSEGVHNDVAHWKKLE